MPFAYYKRLSASARRIYRRSDALSKLPLPDAAALTPLAEAVGEGLQADDVRATQRAATRFMRPLVAQLQAPPLRTWVLARRPADETGELHGLYTLEEGRPAEIRVWMRTAARRQPVAHRTFMRTLLHEVVHHVDFTVLELPESFHTEGFFQREAHLARQILGTPAPRPGQLALPLDVRPPSA